MRRFLIVTLWMMTSAVWADNIIKIGVLAYRPKEQTLQQWQPLADYLAKSLNQPVSLVAYNYPELNLAVARNHVDVVLTNPAHYIYLRDQFRLSSPLATLVTLSGTHYVSRFGGVIFARVDDSSIKTLADIQNKRVAIINGGSLGGYQMQALELLKANLHLPESLVITGLPHDKTVQAVLNHEADVGFIRTGVLESLIKEGKLNPQTIKVIHGLTDIDYPYLHSTPLYPEWPLAVMSSLDPNISKKIAVAILSLPVSKNNASLIGQYSFVLPEDYSSVERLMRSLRLPPYNQAPTFTLVDFWQKYSTILLILGLGLLLILAGGLGFFIQNKRIIRFQKELLANEARFIDFFNKNKSVMLLINPKDGLILEANPMAVAFYGYALEQLKKMSIFNINIASLEEIKQEMAIAMREERNFFKFKHRLANQEVRDVEVYSSPTLMNGEKVLFTIIHDVTQRTQLEKQLKLYGCVFTHAREGILITDADINIIDVNDEFCAITGYSKQEVLGKNPKLLSSGQQNLAFYNALWRDLKQNGFWCGEIWNRKKNGEVYAEMLSISAIKNEQQQIMNYVALFSDITVKKDYENELKHIALYDVLTGLPNRTLLMETLNHALSISINNHHGVVLLYIDLDGFKTVNDTFGHNIGDELLKIVAGRMQQILRKSDTLARVGGDEFIAVLDLFNHINEALPLLERLLKVTSQTIVINDHAMNVSASIGVSFFSDTFVDADQLIRQADEAMYQAKQLGKDRYHIYTEKPSLPLALPEGTPNNS